MDAIQTSDPTGIGPGTPGQASAFRRALDRQALHTEAREGPLDLTAPLNFAEIRAALSRSGSGVRQPVPEAAPAPAAAGARSGGTRSGGAHGARRRAGGHAGSKRVGRIGMFVALATALSVGTAAALVFSSGGQGTSVSLPTTSGNLPVATLRGGPGAVPPDSTSSPAPGTPSPSTHATPSLSPSPSAPATTPSTSPSSQPTDSGSAGASQNSGTPSGAAFTTLQQGSTGDAVVQVQQMLAELDLLYRMRHQTVFVDAQDYRLADPKGTYGQATAAAVAAFQQQAGVGSQLGVCDQATFDALTAEVSDQAGSAGQSTYLADGESALVVVV